MGTKTITLNTKFSDLSGVEDDTVVEVLFTVGGKAYAIDLTPQEVQGFTEVLKPYVSAARPAKKGRGKTTTGTGGVKSGVGDAAVRAWATENGVAVNPKGRVQKATREAYEAAHTPPPAATFAEPT